MSKIPENILQAGCIAYTATFLHGNGSLGDGVEAAYFAIHEHDDWVRAGSPVWNGEGLPPVGTVCEARIYDGKGNLDWFECRVIHHHPLYEGSAAIAHGREELLGWSGEFRPIRTPEQIAADEREVACAQLLIDCHQSDNAFARAQAARLYDAGWRKQAGTDVTALLERVLTLRGTLELHGLLGDVEAALAKAKQVAP